MKASDQVLKRVRIAAPWPANWDNMDGDERVRQCALCKLNVYNLSGMSRQEATKLVSEAEGRLCVRYYQRRDGTVITRDCPIGIRTVKKKLASVVACVFVLFTAGIAFASNLSRRASSASSTSMILADAKERMRQTEPFKSVLNWIDPPRQAPIVGMMTVNWPRQPSPNLGQPSPPNQSSP